MYTVGRGGRSLVVLCTLIVIAVVHGLTYLLNVSVHCGRGGEELSSAVYTCSYRCNTWTTYQLEVSVHYALLEELQ